MAAHRTLTRRSFLSAALVGLPAKSERLITGSFVNDSHGLGHRLRDRTQWPEPKRTVKTPIVIVGGGIAGLSAAWQLAKRGFSDFVLLEMQSEAGGNSRSGSNEFTPYPWAAHYVPVPGTKAMLVRELMEDLGVLHQGQWEERYLCFSPQERLYIHGRWQEGILPETGTTSRDRTQYRRFHELIEEQRATGLYTIPMDEGARPSPLDSISMSEWMRRNGLDSEYLNWHVDYACRDDYGAHSVETSAFAGIHYFAAREHDEKGPLTWPEGNGWIVRKLSEKLQNHLHLNAPVHRIEREGRRVRVYSPDRIFDCSAVVFAAPTLIARYVLEGAPAVPINYSPWITANLTLDRMPREKGIEPAWDNVIYGSASLGYVVATHMSLASRSERSVWTWYHAMASGAPATNRRLLLEKDWGYWKEFILNDLSRAHPDIRECVSRIDVMRMGHAMARPTPGSIFSETRRTLTRAPGPIFYANSDVSGYSIFEEAQYRGVRGADRALQYLRR